MHRVVPELIVEGYREGRRSGELQAAGMFIDLSGFSMITDVLMQDRQHGAEQLTALTYSVFEPLVRAVFEHGGSIAGFAGDGITAIYPAQDGIGAAAQNALASAHSIQQRLASMASLQTPYGAFPISAKIGIACGNVSWGILESRDRRKATYYFRGSAVEDAARAEQHARAGEILLDKSAADQFAELAGGELPHGFTSVVAARMVLPAAQPVIEQPIDPEIGRIFAPEIVVAGSLRGEFRQVVNLSIRIPTLSDAVLRDFVATLFELQERYGGLLSHMDFGDKGCTMLMLWGAPTAYENDIGRALNLALDLQAKAGFPIAAGITYHEARAGYVGSALFEDYTCYGWGVNLAARLMTSAPDGEIWIDDGIVQRASKAFEADLLGEQAFKGFAQKQRVYKLTGRRVAADALYAGVLAGRDAELKVLADRMEPLWRGEYAGITLIRGEAGIGKSRLIHEFSQTEASVHRESLWAVCPCDQILRQPFNPFRYALLKYFGGMNSPQQADRLQTFNSELDDLIAGTTDEGVIEDLRRGRSFLAAMMDLHMADSPYERMDAQGRYDNTLLALIAVLKAECLRAPLVLLIEDAHYLDEDSKALLLRLKRILLAAPAGYPVGIIITARREGLDPSIESDFADHVVELAGLSRDAMAGLANEMLGRPAGPELIRFLAQRAEGNPFFAEQILRYLRDESLLELDAAGNWRVRAGWQASILPADVTSMLVARLDQLAPQVKDVVQTASVLGREFEIQVLARMLKDDAELEKEVVEAEHASIWLPLNELRYFFRHALLRDAAYSMQLEAHRRELHALALEALEALYGNELPSLYPELAYHSEQAAVVDKARVYLRKAADAARDSYQNLQAVEYYSRALNLTTPDAVSERFALLKERALLYRRLGNRKAEDADLDALERMAREMGGKRLRAWVAMQRAEYVLTMGDFHESIECATDAVNLAQAAGDVDVTLGASLILPSALLRQGKIGEAMQRAEATLQIAREAQRQAEEGAALNLMGLIASEQKEPARARRYFEQALSIARERADRALEWKSLSNLGMSTGFIEGDYAAARDYYQQAYTMVHEWGDRPAEGTALANLGWAAGMQGDLAAARAYQDGALTTAREIGDPYQEAYTLINLSALAGIQGDAEAAVRYALEAEALASRIGDRSGRAWALLYKGHAHLAQRELDRAQEAFQLSVGLRDELEQKGLSAEPLAGLIQVALERSDIAAASRAAEVIMSHLEAGGTLDGTEEPLRIYLACYRVLDIQGDPRAQTVLRVARKMLDVQLSKFRDDEARRMYLENVPWRLAVQQAWEASRWR